MCFELVLARAKYLLGLLNLRLGGASQTQKTAKYASEGSQLAKELVKRAHGGAQLAQETLKRASEGLKELNLASGGLEVPSPQGDQLGLNPEGPLGPQEDPASNKPSQASGDP